MKMFLRPYTGLVLCVIALGGCAQGFSKSIWNPFGLELGFDITQKPVRIGIVSAHEGPLALQNWLPVKPAPPYAALRDGLAKHLGCGVQIQELEPFQIAAHLQTGRIEYALMSEADYQSITAQEPIGHTLAAAVPLVRRGVIVASAKSGVNALADIKGKRFAFGPKNDAVLDVAALQALTAAGISKDDIQKELIPNPIYPSLDRLQYHVSSLEAAKEVVYGIGTEVGVVEESDYQAFPDTGGRLLPLRLAKNDFRVLGQTEVVTATTTLAGPFVASDQANPEVTSKIVEFLAAAEKQNAGALQELGLSRFELTPAGTAAGSAVVRSTTPSK